MCVARPAMLCSLYALPFLTLIRGRDLCCLPPPGISQGGLSTYELGLTASLVARLIGLLLVLTSQG